MSVFRRYWATYPFEARDAFEVSMGEGETLVVAQTAPGVWPDPFKWMKGRNEVTGKEGEFPGTYVQFVEEFTVADERPRPEPARTPPPTAPRPGRDTPDTGRPGSGRGDTPDCEEDAPPPVPKRNQSKSGESELVYIRVSAHGAILLYPPKMVVCSFRC